MEQNLREIRELSELYGEMQRTNFALDILEQAIRYKNRRHKIDCAICTCMGALVALVFAIVTFGA